MRCFVCAAILLIPAAIRTAEPATHQIHLDGQTFTLPIGFTIERVAGPPLVNRPIVADFDEEGRLYVADSSGSNEKVEVQVTKRPHRIVRLQPSANGRFEKATDFADKMMFPEGVLWHAGSLYVAAPPSIWKLTDTDGDGVADKREEWFQGKTLTGCANDLHGPYLGPDGWLYWCKGAFAEQTIERPGRAPLLSRAAHIFRARPDGSSREIVMTGGMDNPVEVAFTQTGEAFFTATFVQHPGGGRRDGLMHAIYGSVYGKENTALDGHIRTSPDLMPVMTHLGPAAPSGLCIYESTSFGNDFEGNAFVAQFNMRKISRHDLEPDYGTFRSKNSDFLTSDNFDFHPTDVLEDADGSLLVIDTGGWYKLCCPTAQLAKPDVLGAIYRIRRVDALRIEDPRGLKLDWSLPQWQWLDDPRPAVRKRAIAALAARGADAIPELTRACHVSRSSRSKQNAIWALARIRDGRGSAVIREMLHDNDESVVQSAAHAVSVNRIKGTEGTLKLLLRHSSPAVQRIAAEALGRIGGADDVAAILRAIQETSHESVKHSLVYALIEISQPEATRIGLTSAFTNVRLAALVALEQMPGGHLKFDELTSAWRHKDENPRSIAYWILGRHPEWAEQLASAMREKVATPIPQSSRERDQLIALLSKSAKSPAVQAVLADALRTNWREIALDAMRGANVRPVPVIWIDSVLRLVEGDSPPAALGLLRTWKLPADKSIVVADRLKALARNPANAAELRIQALAALPPGSLQSDLDLERWLFERLRESEPIALRSPAADIIARGGFTSEQLLRLVDAISHVGPMELDRVLDAFSACSDDEVGTKLFATLQTIKPLLRVATLRPRLAKFGPAIQTKAEQLYRELDAESSKQAERLDSLAARLKSGDIRRGQAVFNSQKAACSACHAVGYVGGAIGPDLTKIGAIRTERDLLESILFPSASFVRGYEPVSVMTRRGVPVNGLIKRDSPDEVVVTLSATEEVRISRGDIESISPGAVSIMPAGLDQLLSEQDLADLIAFLKACR